MSGEGRGDPSYTDAGVASLDDARVFDPSFKVRFKAVSLGKCEGTIGPGTDLHLYRVVRRSPGFASPDDL